MAAHFLQTRRWLGALVPAWCIAPRPPDLLPSVRRQRRPASDVWACHGPPAPRRCPALRREAGVDGGDVQAEWRQRSPIWADLVIRVRQSCRLGSGAGAFRYGYKTRRLGSDQRTKTGCSWRRTGVDRCRRLWPARRSSLLHKVAGPPLDGSPTQTSRQSETRNTPKVRWSS